MTQFVRQYTGPAETGRHHRRQPPFSLAQLPVGVSSDSHPEQVYLHR